MKSNKLFLGVSVLAILFLGWQEAMAVPAAPITYELTQPNGKTFKARTVGDEWNHWTITQDGYTILKDKASGYWVYAQKGSEETLSKSALKISIDSPEGIEKGLMPKLKSMPRQGITPSLRAPGQPGSPTYVPPVGTSGSQPVLIILTMFKDRAYLLTNQSDWSASFFGASSVKDYYKEVSYDVLDLTPAIETYNVVNDGVITVNLSYDHPGDVGSQQTAYDALVEAAKINAETGEPYVKFGDFDTDGNDYISTEELHIVIVLAGFEGAYGNGACIPNVWAHHWSLGGGFPAPTLDGVVVGDFAGYGGYVQLGELHGIGGICASAHMATIGVMAHELGHDLWLPDMYDIAEAKIAGIGAWGIMSGGCWNSVSLPGDSPAHPTSWDRWYEGWLTPIQVTNSVSVSIPEVETSSTVYQLIDNPNDVDWSFYGSSGSGEYFLVENRQQTGYDVGLPACGILIWHIDETVVSDNTANMNEWGQRLVALKQADGLFHLETSVDDGGNSGDGGDPYLAGDSFDGDTTPSSHFYDGSPSGVTVSVNSDCGQNITVDLAICSLDTYYGDIDGDTYGDPNNTIQDCSVGSPPVGYVSNNQDCDDGDSNIYPGATEVCDGVDNNCDGELDETFITSTYYRDADGDTYGNPAVTTEACFIPSGYVANNTDCDDTNSGINPAAAEVCDGLDNNCDGQTDEGSPPFTYYRDADNDGYGNPSVSTQACTTPSGYVSNSTDCDDTNPGVNPGGSEACDGLDNDCNGAVDDGGLADNDGDGLCDGVDSDDDNDGLPDSWELSNGFDPLDATGDNGASGDPDGDGFTNLQEYERDWDPNHASTTWYADVKTTSAIEDGSASYPFDTITEAIAAGYNGDTIWVDTGIYLEKINFNGKTLVLMAEAGTEGTIIDGQDSGSVVTFENGEGAYAELNGFIIKSGNAGIGGGITVLNGSSPTIVNNIIVSNRAVYGGGIGCNGSSPTIINNTITNNIANALGGGIYCIETSSSPTVTNTIIWNNGDEIYLDNGASITVTYSDVEGGYTGTGNIDSDPLFVDSVNADYHLQAGSPCINSGTTPADGIPIDDIDADDRPQGANYDMGADEYVSTAGGGGGTSTSTSISAEGGGGSGGCFVATAAYGTPMAQQVSVLCQFRDQYLLSSTWGRKFVVLYYKYSPSLANYIADKAALRLAVRTCLVPLLLLALFMVKLGLVSKLLVASSLLGLPIAWRVLNKRSS